MDRPVMIEIRRRASEWFDRYLKVARGNGLQPGETLPALLLLVQALHHAKDKMESYHALEAMKTLTFAMTCTKPLTVKWEYQPYTVVPYEVRHFGIGPATLFIEAARNTIWDEEHLLFMQQTNKRAMRLLTNDERPILSFDVYRDPTPEERATLQHGSLAGQRVGGSVAMDPQQKLILNFFPKKPTAVVQSGPSMPPVPGSTSMPLQSDPVMPHVLQQAAPVAQGPAAVQTHATAPVMSAPISMPVNLPGVGAVGQGPSAEPAVVNMPRVPTPQQP
jgi:hypothetical protein